MCPSKIPATTYGKTLIAGGVREKTGGATPGSKNLTPIRELKTHAPETPANHLHPTTPARTITLFTHTVENILFRRVNRKKKHRQSS